MMIKTLLLDFRFVVTVYLRVKNFKIEWFFLSRNFCDKHFTILQITTIMQWLTQIIVHFVIKASNLVYRVLRSYILLSLRVGTTKICKVGYRNHWSHNDLFLHASHTNTVSTMASSSYMSMHTIFALNFILVTTLCNLDSYLLHLTH